MSNHTGHSKQTAETARLGAKIRRRRGKGIKWGKICEELQIFKEDGSPDPGLAYRIAFDDYEPKGRAVRSRLGLREICFACERAFRTVRRRVSELPPWRAWWQRLPPADRDRRIRETYEREK